MERERHKRLRREKGGRRKGRELREKNRAVVEGEEKEWRDGCHAERKGEGRG